MHADDQDIFGPSFQETKIHPTVETPPIKKQHPSVDNDLTSAKPFKTCTKSSKIKFFLHFLTIFDRFRILKIF